MCSAGYGEKIASERHGLNGLFVKFSAIADQ